MSRIEKVVIIILIATAFAGIGLSYYRKISQEATVLISAQKVSRAEEAVGIIAGRKIVNINTADRRTLTRLPGIGLRLAQRIIDYRREISRFSSADELLEIKGIGPKKYESLKDYVILEGDEPR